MARVASTLLVLALLGGTAAAFAVTQDLKLEPSPITEPRIDKLFSPVGEASARTARIGFTLRRADTVTVAIVDEDGNEVRTLVRERPLPRGPVAFEWDGRDEDGSLVPDGIYHPRVTLDRGHRTIRLPSVIEVDTRPPRIVLTGVRPRVFSPDRDGRREVVRVRYRVDEVAQPLLFVEGKRRIRGRFRRGPGSLEWFGKLERKPLPAGRYALTLRAQDAAGNISRPTPPAHVRIRYIELARRLVRARAGAPLAVPVSTDARRVRWIVDRRTGVGAAPILRLRAPRAPGRYRLYVSASGHADSALVIVSGP